MPTTVARPQLGTDEPPMLATPKFINWNVPPIIMAVFISPIINPAKNATMIGNHVVITIPCWSKTIHIDNNTINTP